MRCEICAVGCDIPPGGYGRCRMYTADDSGILERFPNTFLAAFPVAIETQPMLHFYPEASSCRSAPQDAISIARDVSPRYSSTMRSPLRDRGRHSV